jgi:predicted RNA-binding protein with PUA-like domain
VAHWLVKSEPGDYSYADLEREGRSIWDGVRNPVALRHMRAVQPGDPVFFYHTGKERSIVGIAAVDSEAYPDPEAESERIVVFEIVPRQRLAVPVTLSDIKKDRAFADWELVRVPRLSVMPVPERLWSRVLDMAGAG